MKKRFHDDHKCSKQKANVPEENVIQMLSLTGGEVVKLVHIGDARKVAAAREDEEKMAWELSQSDRMWRCMWSFAGNKTRLQRRHFRLRRDVPRITMEHGRAPQSVALH